MEGYINLHNAFSLFQQRTNYYGNCISPLPSAEVEGLMPVIAAVWWEVGAGLKHPRATCLAGSMWGHERGDLLSLHGGERFIPRRWSGAVHSAKLGKVRSAG